MLAPVASYSSSAVAAVGLTRPTSTRSIGGADAEMPTAAEMHTAAEIAYRV